MIAKEKETAPPTDKWGLAGHQAEIQMAFYLRRAFADVPDVHVFNDLRITRAGETAQMDHLVFHRYGFVIVESKSVTGTIEVNRHGEFSRRHGNQRSGMKSPIVQARMQGGILSKLLNDHCEELRRKVMFGMVQGEFGQERFHFLVAVSDQGVIERNGVDPPELVKADAVVDRIHEIMALNAEAGGAKGFAKLMFANRETEKRILKHRVLAYTDEEMRAIGSFLWEQHEPRVPPMTDRERPSPRRPATPPTPPPIAVKNPGDIAPTKPQQSSLNQATCRHCQSEDLFVAHGKFGYYFKCRKCDGNTPIAAKCGECGNKARLRKSGRDFALCCSQCQLEVPFFQNPID